MPTTRRRYHARSTYGTGPRRHLNRDDRARFRFLARLHARAGRLTPKGQWVADALLKHLGEDGQCDPSHAILAQDAACDPSTVAEALKRMAELGMVTWTRRIVRDGWAVRQTSNAYCLFTPIVTEVSSDREKPRGTPRKYLSTVSEQDRAAFANAERQIAMLTGQTLPS